MRIVKALVIQIANPDYLMPLRFQMDDYQVLFAPFLQCFLPETRKFQRVAGIMQWEVISGDGKGLTTPFRGQMSLLIEFGYFIYYS